MMTMIIIKANYYRFLNKKKIGCYSFSGCDGDVMCDCVNNSTHRCILRGLPAEYG